MPYRLSFKFVFLASAIILLTTSCQTHAPTYRVSSAPPSKRKVVKKRTKDTEVAKIDSKKSNLRTDIVNEAHKYIGTQYIYGGKTPRPGFDCSGFLTYVFNKKGVSLSGSSKTLSRLGKKKSTKSLQSGDLAFFGSSGKVSHVALIIEHNGNQLKVIHSTSKGGVRVDDVFSSDYWRSKYLFSRSIIEE